MKAAAIVALGLLMAANAGLGKEGKEKTTVTFTGKQVKGTGPLNNARTSSDVLVVNKGARIVKVDGTGDYCIWRRGEYRAYKCSNKNKDLVGTSLPAGSYTILPAVGKHQASARTSITISCPDCRVEKKAH